MVLTVSVDKFSYIYTSWLKGCCIACYRIGSKLQAATVIQYPGKHPLLKKGKIDPIKLEVEQRGSKKKVCHIFLLLLFVLSVFLSVEISERVSAVAPVMLIHLPVKDTFWSPCICCPGENIPIMTGHLKCWDTFSWSQESFHQRYRTVFTMYKLFRRSKGGNKSSVESMLLRPKQVSAAKAGDRKRQDTEQRQYLYIPSYSTKYFRHAGQFTLRF